MNRLIGMKSNKAQIGNIIKRACPILSTPCSEELNLPESDQDILPDLVLSCAFFIAPNSILKAITHAANKITIIGYKFNGTA